jgi:hypothetical protein
MKKARWLFWLWVALISFFYTGLVFGQTITFGETASTGSAVDNNANTLLWQQADLSANGVAQQACITVTSATGGVWLGVYSAQGQQEVAVQIPALVPGKNCVTTPPVPLAAGTHYLAHLPQNITNYQKLTTSGVGYGPGAWAPLSYGAGLPPTLPAAGGTDTVHWMVYWVVSTAPLPSPSPSSSPSPSPTPSPSPSPTPTPTPSPSPSPSPPVLTVLMARSESAGAQVYGHVIAATSVPLVCKMDYGPTINFGATDAHETVAAANHFFWFPATPSAVYFWQITCGSLVAGGKLPTPGLP